MLDPHLLHALHVQAVRHAELPAGSEPHELFQVSTIEALLHGAYDGDVTVAELSGRGDLGLGTFNALDGELVLADGVLYRAAQDGSVHPAEPERRSPFALVTTFQAVDALLSQVAPQSPSCTAVRIEGRFEHIRLRSVAPQRKPYPPLTDVLADQSVFDENDIEGVVVGFCFPAHAGRLNLPGRHLHFLSSDRARGGHVLSCRPAECVVRVDHEAEIEVELPPGVELKVHPGDAPDDSGELLRFEQD